MLDQLLELDQFLANYPRTNLFPTPPVGELHTDLPQCCDSVQFT